MQLRVVGVPRINVVPNVLGGEMTPPTIHLLKCWPASFKALLSGEKKHEVRKDDRAFAVGDLLRLDEWMPHRPPNFYDGEFREVFQASQGEYSGRQLWMIVTYKSEPGTWGLPEKLCVLSVAPHEAPNVQTP